MKLGSIIEYTTRYKEEFALYEGLILSAPAGVVVEKLSNHFARCRFIKDLFSGTIRMISSSFQASSLRDLEQLLGSLGWFMSAFDVELKDDAAKISDRYDGDRLAKLLSRPVRRLAISFEPKFDLNIPKDAWPKYLFHVTPKKRLKKILKVGLTPKSRGKTSSHPDRIYLGKDRDDIVHGLMPELAKYEEDNIEWSLLTIDPDFIGGPFRLFRDPNYSYGVYSLMNVPPKAIISTEDI
jgi:hypothetical protein